MADTPRLETTEFTSKAPQRRISSLPARRRSSVIPSRKKEEKRGGSALLVLGVCMLCCALLLSTAFFDEPFVETMAVSAENGSPSITGEDILGRLKFLFERVVEVFEKKELSMPVDGEVTAYFSTGHEYLELTGEAGCDVFAALDGTVEAVGSDESGGFAILAHENGVRTIYRALGDVCVEEGQPVRIGDALGTAPSGRVFFSYESAGEILDPLSYLGLKAK